jgi:hypothetical protein
MRSAVDISLPSLSGVGFPRDKHTLNLVEHQ